MTDLLILENDTPAGQRIRSCEQIENRCLSGPIGPDKTDYFAFIDVKIDIFDGGKASE
jgi:hypothetical protein